MAIDQECIAKEPARGDGTDEIGTSDSDSSENTEDSDGVVATRSGNPDGCRQSNTDAHTLYTCDSVVETVQNEPLQCSGGALDGRKEIKRLVDAVKTHSGEWGENGL
jgi:hypothetical protein